MSITWLHGDPDGERQTIHHVEGPGGFTQAFDADDIDLLLRLGLIKETKRTSSSEWETIFYGPAS